MSVIAQQVARWQKDVEHTRDYCITITARSDPKRWIQITLMNFNVAYLWSKPPEDALREHQIAVPPEIELSEWEAGTYATWDHGWEDVPALTKFLSDYWQKVLGVPDTAEAVTISEFD